MRRSTAIGTTSVLVVLLALSVLVQAWAIPSMVQRIVATFPEVAFLTVPSIVWGVLAIGCWEAVGVILLRMVRLARRQWMDLTARRWLRAVIVWLAAFIALVTVAFTALTVMNYATPGVMLGLIGGGLIAAVAATCLAVSLGMRPAVSRAASV